MLVRFLDAQQFLLLRSQGIEDRLTMALALNEEVSAKLRHQRRHLPMLRIRQWCFLVEAEAS
jgi:hypothetical protein